MGMSPSGKAAAFDSVYRRFDSGHSRQGDLANRPSFSNLEASFQAVR